MMRIVILADACAPRPTSEPNLGRGWGVPHTRAPLARSAMGGVGCAFFGGCTATQTRLLGGGHDAVDQQFGAISAAGCTVGFQRNVDRNISWRVGDPDAPPTGSGNRIATIDLRCARDVAAAHDGPTTSTGCLISGGLS